MTQYTRTMHPGLEYSSGGRLTFLGQDISLLAERFGTPLYVYAADLIKEALYCLKTALGTRPYLICYAVKANSNLSILRLIQEQGCGADIVSSGELYRTEQAQIPPEKIIFSGMGKTAEELKAALEAGVRLISVESEAELHLLNTLALGLGLEAQVSLRINPAVEADTHPYISTGREHDKFGIPSDQVLNIYERARKLKGLHICGLGFHIGSQIMDTEAFSSAAKVLSRIAARVEDKGLSLKYIDVGGGLGITYDSEKPPSVEAYIQSILTELPLKNGKTTLILEPGRFLLGNAGILITQILFTKSTNTKNFYIVDAAMNDLLRPALYQAHHEILAHRKEIQEKEHSQADMVGPICESGDFLARDRLLPPFVAYDHAVLCSAGAYGFVMSSNYNTRRRAAEVLIEGKGSKSQARLVRRRESYAELLQCESDL